MKALAVFLTAALVLIGTVAVSVAQEVVEVGGSGTSTGTIGEGSGGKIAIQQGALDFVVPSTQAIKAWGPGEWFRVFGVAVSALYEDVRVDGRVVVSQSIEADDWTNGRPYTTFEMYRLYANGVLVGEVYPVAKESGYVGNLTIIFIINPDKQIWIGKDEIANLELHAVLNRDQNMIAEGSKHQFYLHPDPLGDGKWAVSGVGASSATTISGPSETLYGPEVVVSSGSGGDIYVGPKLFIADVSVVKSDKPQDVKIPLQLVDGAVYGGVFVASGQCIGWDTDGEGGSEPITAPVAFMYEPRDGMLAETRTVEEDDNVFIVVTFGPNPVGDNLGSLIVTVPPWARFTHIKWEAGLNTESGYSTDEIDGETVITVLPPFPPILVRVEPAEICMGDTVRIYIEGGESPFSVSVLSSEYYPSLHTAIPGQSDREWLLVPAEGWIEKWSVEYWPNDDTQGPVYIMVSDMYYSETAKVIVKPRWGDVSGNGVVTPYDASLVARALLELVKFFEYQAVVADFDRMIGRWGRVDIWDCINILRYTVGLPVIVHDVDASAKPSMDVLVNALRILDDSDLSSAEAAPIREILNRAIGENGGGVLPREFRLEQNYPNPFNPETTVNYDVARVGQVSLVVYDVLGRRVATLASGYHAAGKYQTVWDAGGVAGGVYFCAMEAEDFRSVKKMLLVK